MKKTLLIAGIVLIVVAVLALLYALLNRFSYYHLLDGSSEQYARFHQRMNVSFIAGLVLAVIGAVCLFLRTKKNLRPRTLR